jgi:hypothetical protein
LEYDIILFLEIIQTEGCRFSREDVVDGERIHWYLCVNGARRVQILVTDEVMTLTTSKDLLRQLGLEDLIPRMFNGE